jgi:Mg2+/citrate symporter
MQDLNKLPLKSKKFLAYLIADFGWKILIGYTNWKEESKSEIGYTTFLILLSMIVTAGFIQIGYILGQAMLDKYAASIVEIFDKDDSSKLEKKE